MKKIVGTIAAIALAASSAFAGVNVGMGFNRGVWMPVKGDGNDVKVFEGTSWGGAARQGLSFSASSENMGVAIDINGDNGGIGVGDVSCLWAQPWSWLKVTIGKAQADTGRGCAGFGVRDWGRTSEAAKFDDDFTFTRFGNGTGAQAVGAIVKVTPVKGLWAIASIMPGTYTTDDDGNVSSVPKAETVFGIQRDSCRNGKWFIARKYSLCVHWLLSGICERTADDKCISDLRLYRTGTLGSYDDLQFDRNRDPAVF